MQWNMLLLVGGKRAMRWLFKSQNQLTVLGGFVALISFLLSFVVAIGFHAELSTKMIPGS